MVFASQNSPFFCTTSPGPVSPFRFGSLSAGHQLGHLAISENETLGSPESF
jgi:hypothetical protein